MLSRRGTFYCEDLTSGKARERELANKSDENRRASMKKLKNENVELKKRDKNDGSYREGVEAKTPTRDHGLFVQKAAEGIKPFLLILFVTRVEQGRAKND